MAKKLKIADNKKLRFWSLIAIMTVVGGVGLYTLKFSSANSLPTFVTRFSAKEAKNNDPTLTIVTEDNSFGTDQEVLELQPGQMANITPNRGGGTAIPTSLKDCYLMRAANSTVSATITSVSNRLKVSVPVSRAYNYQEYCVQTANGKYAPFTVKNNSGGTLYVYQRINYYTFADPSQW